MNKFYSIFGAIVSVMLFSSFFYLLYIVILSFPALMNGTIGATPVLAVVGIPILGNFLLKWFEKRKDKKDKIELDFREKKLEAYKKMLSQMHALTMNEEVKKKLKLPQNELEWQLLAHEFINAMLLWGSKKSINDWIIYKEESSKEIAGKLTPIRIAAKLMLSIREEMGHSNELKEEELMKFLIPPEDWHLLKEGISEEGEKL